MNAAHALEPAISEPLTWDEIRVRYPDQWVCLAEIGWLNDTDFAFTTARVVGHGTTSRAPLEQARPLRTQYTEVGHFFTGKIARPSPYRLFP
jgi:hypothetical protein